MRGVTVAAVDLGASSGRVVAGRCTPEGLRLQEIHRFPNVPSHRDGRLRWDIGGIFDGVLEGLRRAELQVGPLDSVGVDSWAVDYGLVDGSGVLLADPICYRDAGTASAVQRVLDDLGAAALYEATGVQLQPFNTLFQLLARRECADSRSAAHALLIPDLLACWLGAPPGTELTNASTTQVLDPRTGDWSRSLATRLGFPLHLFADLRRPGDRLGQLDPTLMRRLGLTGSPEIITVPSHDTAAAVAGIPATGGAFAYVCTGTWSLVGLELDAPVITPAAVAANFTNEVGVDGTIRFLKNVTGFWLLQECVRDWQARGTEIDLDALTGQAAAVPGLQALVDLRDPAWSAPGGMPGRIGEACLGTRPASRAAVTRCILDSMALAIRLALREAVSLATQPVEVVHLVGGGVGNPLFCQLVADACELPVLAGPIEAAAWGNALCQARALGVVPGSLVEQRAVVARAEPPVRYLPAGDGRALDAAERRLLAARA